MLTGLILYSIRILVCLTFLFLQSLWSLNEMSMGSSGAGDLSNDNLNPLYRTRRKQFVMLLDRFEEYSVRPHISSLQEHGKELDRLKTKKDRRNLLQRRMDACRTLQQVRVDLVDLARIKEQGQCPEDQEYYDKHGAPLRVQILRAAADFLEKHPEAKRPTQEQEDILLNEEEKHQGYALACDEIEREKDRLADKQDILLRVETIHTDVEHVVGLMEDFWSLLESQGKTVNTIDKNLTEADVSLVEGTEQLALAARYRTALYPVAGAVIGGAVAGPLGMLSGFKLAGLACSAAGLFIGWKGGNVWRRRALMAIPLETIANDTEIALTPREGSEIPTENKFKTE